MYQEFTVFLAGGILPNGTIDHKLLALDEPEEAMIHG
jgi:hypothetical protein